MILNDLRLSYHDLTPRAGARPLDGGGYHSGGRPPARRRRLPLGRAPARSTAAITTRAGARPLDGGDYHSGGDSSRFSLILE